MKVGLIDVDGHNFPNLCLMKLSAYHKARGDTVEWYSPYVMPYDKEHIPQGHELRHLQRYVNNRYIFNSSDCRTFEEYKNNKPKEDADQLKLF